MMILVRVCAVALSRATRAIVIDRSFIVRSRFSLSLCVRVSMCSTKKKRGVRAWVTEKEREKERLGLECVPLFPVDSLRGLFL